jgi:membrane associated rhomboid family serine protease
MRYQYTSRGFNKSYKSNLFIPKGVKILIIINICVFILSQISGLRSIFFSSFGIVPFQVWNNMKLWQLFTYLFIHGGLLHIFFNMFVLWMFGKDLEHEWGTYEFLFFYFICGVGSGLITVLFSANSIIPIVGASGAIYGLLVAYGYMYPDRLVYLYGLFPIRVKYMVLALGIMATFAFIFSKQSNVSHITHVAGMIIGISVLLFNVNIKNIKLEYYKLKLKKLQNKRDVKNNKVIYAKQEVDKILDKLNNSGWESLTDSEEKYLTKMSKEIFKNNTPN